LPGPDLIVEVGGAADTVDLEAAEPRLAAQFLQPRRWQAQCAQPGAAGPGQPRRRRRPTAAGARATGTARSATASPPGPSLRRADRCPVIGILNVTPDSFSGAGWYQAPQAAIAHTLRMTSAGADHVDVRGESTQPGVVRVPLEEELRGILPVITGLCCRGMAVSVGTTRAQVAGAAIEADAVLVNSVSGSLADPGIARAIATASVHWVLIHWRGHSRDMYANATYTDIVADVRRELAARADAALASSIAPSQLVLDPGLGFAKRPEHDLALPANLDAITGRGFPALVGASRKRFLSAILTEGRP
jgi:dihydropteroate synthase